MMLGINLFKAIRATGNNTCVNAYYCTARKSGGKSYRRIVHFPENYTVEPLSTTHLAGRDPMTGRTAVKGIGGGIKHKYHWIQWKRAKDESDSVMSDKVIEILFDGCRTSYVALLARHDNLRYILATENMKPGDIVKTSNFIPRIPVRTKEGDAFPLAALPIGTKVHCLEKNPGQHCHLIHAAGTFGTILRKCDDKVIVQLPSKQEYIFDGRCMATIGRVSNIDRDKKHVGSAQNMRALGNRPRSGLWHRKDGRHGRKLRKPRPANIVKPPPQKEEEPICLTLKK